MMNRGYDQGPHGGRGTQGISKPPIPGFVPPCAAEKKSEDEATRMQLLETLCCNPSSHQGPNYCLSLVTNFLGQNLDAADNNGAGGVRLVSSLMWTLRVSPWNDGFGKGHGLPSPVNNTKQISTILTFRMLLDRKGPTILTISAAAMSRLTLARDIIQRLGSAKRLYGRGTTLSTFHTQHNRGGHPPHSEDYACYRRSLEDAARSVSCCYRSRCSRGAFPAPLEPTARSK